VAQFEKPVPTVATDENPFVHARVMEGYRVPIRIGWAASPTPFAARVPRLCRTHMWSDTHRHTTGSPLIGWRIVVAGKKAC